jgi:hypothetical protein
MRFLPAAIAVLALGAVFLRVDMRELRAAILQGHVAAILPWAALLAIGYMALHSLWERMLLSHTPVPPSYYDVWTGKVGTAVLNSIGFALGSGGYVVWIARATGAGVGGALALRTIAIVADLAALALVTLIAILVIQATVPAAVTVGTIGALGLVTIVALGLRFSFIPRRLVPSAHFTNFVATAAAVSLTTWGTQVLGRAVSMCLSIATTAFAAIAFGLHIPVAIICALVPVSMFVRVMPVNVAGFGAAQAAFVMVFAPYESAAKLLAFNILWQLAANVFYVLRGLPFVNRATSQIVSPQSPQ